MFINCPYCNALVATDPATDTPPERCPRCASLLRRPPEMVAEFQVTALPPSPADPLAGTQGSLLDDAAAAPAVGMVAADVVAAEIVAAEMVAVEMDAAEMVASKMVAADMVAVEMPAVEAPAVALIAAEVPVVEAVPVAAPVIDVPSVEIVAVDDGHADARAADVPSAVAPELPAPPPAKMHVRYVFRNAPVVLPTVAAAADAPVDAAPVDAPLVDAGLPATPPRDASDAAQLDGEPADSVPPAGHPSASHPIDVAHVAAGMAQAAAVLQVLGEQAAAQAAGPLPATATAGPPRSRPAARPSGSGTSPSFARHHAGPGRARWPDWRTSTALAGLSLLLLLQLVLADRDALAADARWRPAMTSLCGVLGCALPAWHEPSAMTLLARDVRPHATVADVLRVSASFRNDARWAQPWPALQLTLADVEGRPAGTRTFAPGDYLGAAPTQALLAPGQVATIAMDVVEPASSSVAFTFEFQ